MNRLVGDEVWNRIGIEIPDVKSVLISAPPTKAVPTNTKQIAANIPVVPRNSKKLVEFGVEIPLLVLVFLAIDLDETGRADRYRKVDCKVVIW
jgi:hypothetical protein